MLDKFDIIHRQREFQELCEVNIHTIVESEINRLSETFLFKAIEEIIELRRTFPSALNKWSKSQGDGNRQQILAEFSDVILFLTNFAIVRGITPAELQAAVAKTQEINFLKLKAKKLSILEDEMKRTPSKRIGLGGGNPMPALVVIGQNPGQGLEDGQNCWDNAPKKSAVGFLKEALAYGVDIWNLLPTEIYFTNLVKEVTDDNREPDQSVIDYWFPFLQRELDIVTSGSNPQIIAMGKTATKALLQHGIPPHDSIIHPSWYMRNGFTAKQYYEDQLKNKLKGLEK